MTDLSPLTATRGQMMASSAVPIRHCRHELHPAIDASHATPRFKTAFCLSFARPRLLFSSEHGQGRARF